MVLLITCILVLITAGSIYKLSEWAKNYFRPKTFVALFLLKLLYGLCFYWVYTSYYGNQQESDMYKFLSDAQKVYDLTQHKTSNYIHILTGIGINESDDEITQQLDFWYQEESASVINDSRMIIRFNLLLLPWSGGHLLVHLVIMVFLSFIGLWLLYHCFERFFRGHEIYLLFTCFGIPSVMFWSSGVMKEGPLIFFIGVTVFALWQSNLKLYFRAILFILGFWGILFAKFYIALALIPSLLFLALLRLFIRIKPVTSLLVTVLLLGISGVIFNAALHNLPLQKLSKKQNDFINLSIGGTYLKNTEAPFDTIFTLSQEALMYSSKHLNQTKVKLRPGTVYHHWKNPGYADTLVVQDTLNSYHILKTLEPTGSAISLERLYPNYKSLIAMLPAAFLNVFFRPFIFDVNNAFSLLACVENLFILIIILITLTHLKKVTEKELSLIIFSLLFVIVLYTLVGITTPVLGAVVRYKVPALPFLMIALLLLADKAKLTYFYRIVKWIKCKQF